MAFTQQLRVAEERYIWHGATFRLPVSTLQKPRKQEGWELPDIAVKCRALLLRCMWVHSKEGTATAKWLKAWGLVRPQANPPKVGMIPQRLAYLRQYACDDSMTPYSTWQNGTRFT